MALYVRLFNATGGDAAHDLRIGFDGRVVGVLKPAVNKAGERTVRLRWR